MPSAPVIGALVGLCVVLGWTVSRWRADVRELRGRLDVAANQLQNLQVSFSRFAPEELIERIIRDGEMVKGQRLEVTVLFADLVGFTALSEAMDPDVLVRVLNGYFERMSAAVSAHRGYVSTLVGDGILALFGALAPNPWQGDDAAHAALAMQEALRDYNEELERQGLPQLRLGIGLHRGVGVAGLVGSKDLMEFTVVGRTINLAARVQDLTRQYDSDIILTQELLGQLDPGFELTPLPPTAVKGVSEPVQIHGVGGYRSQAAG